MSVRKVPKSHPKQPGILPKILILVGIALLIIVVFLIKNQPAQTEILTGKPPETQYDWYLENHQPVFVFFHSTTCKTCTEMMAEVDQVYPEFKDRVGMVDVDVYLSWNKDLLSRARITSIPTQVFINAKGESKMMIGGMHPDELRAQLQILAGG
jgi:thiol-disulfide isomerase/thioredoxin